MAIAQDKPTIIVVRVLVLSIFAYQLAQPVQADIEFDNLALQFQNGFGLASEKLGIALGTNQPPQNVQEADKRMRDLYVAIERILMDARQRAANVRSSLISTAIERLRLI